VYTCFKGNSKWLYVPSRPAIFFTEPFIHSFILRDRAAASETTYIVHYSRPAFHRDALENGEHGEDDAVEADDAELGSLPAGRADGLAGRADEAAAAEAAPAAVAAAVRRAWRHFRLARQVPLVCTTRTLSHSIGCIVTLSGRSFVLVIWCCTCC